MRFKMEKNIPAYVVSEGVYKSAQEKKNFFSADRKFGLKRRKTVEGHFRHPNKLHIYFRKVPLKGD